MSDLTLTDFWRLVTVNDRTAEPESVCQSLKAALSDLSDEQLIEFDNQTKPRIDSSKPNIKND